MKRILLALTMIAASAAPASAQPETITFDSTPSGVTAFVIVANANPALWGFTPLRSIPCVTPCRVTYTGALARIQFPGYLASSRVRVEWRADHLETNPPIIALTPMPAPPSAPAPAPAH